jgi:hypothetical protein
VTSSDPTGLVPCHGRDEGDLCPGQTAGAWAGTLAGDQARARLFPENHCSLRSPARRRPAAVAAGAGHGVDPVALVGPESLPPDVAARQRAQAPLLRLNDRVYEATAKYYDEQFTGAGVDVATNTLTVYWSGAVPVELAGLRVELAESGPNLTIRPAPFSRRQLMAAADRVMPIAEGPATIELALDGSGITVAMADLPAVARGSRAVRLLAGYTNEPYLYVGDTRASRIAVAGYAGGGIPAWGNYCIHGMHAINCNLFSALTVKEFTGWPPEGRCVYTIGMTRYGSEIIWCHGDSGAPIYYWSGGTVIAAGLASWSNHEVEPCSYTGGASVVATAVNTIPGLRVTTISSP